MATDFVHLHLHTEYSLLDGLTNIKKLMARVKELNMNSVAITDHGAMYGAIEFYKHGLKEGVKPIIGMEAYTTPFDHTKREGKEERQIHHLLLLAKNEEGYRNLMKISSTAWLEGYYYRPRIDRPTLAKYSKGIICTSACPAGELAEKIVDNNMDEARKTVQWFLDVFGEDYYLEVQNHEFSKFIEKATDSGIKAELTKMAGMEKVIKEGVIKLSREFGVPIVATNDSHYLNKEDANAQDAMVCVATGKQVADIKRIRFIDCPNYYVKSPDEMKELFLDLPEAISNTVKVAEKCNLNLTLGQYFFPQVSIPNKQTAEEYIQKLAWDALVIKFPKATQEYKDRLTYELKIICDKGYASYFLIFYDLARWATEKKIPINVRGSVAGSLTTYVLGITIVDPIYFQVPFERFLNPYRPSAPDIDMDIADDMRDQMIEYLGTRYGHDKVAQICTFGRMLARAAARDVARVLGYEYAVGDRISKLIPPPKQGFPINIPTALETSHELKSLYNSDSDAKKILDLAHQVEGSARHVSVHAAGVVISPSELTDFTPLHIDTREGNKVITQYEMHAVEDVGLVKLDILGIRNLSILRESINIVKKVTGKEIDLFKIPLDDTKTFKMLSAGNTMGVFQLSGSGMTRYLVEMNPSKIEDIMIMIALFRPGPMENIDEYIARKKGVKPISYYHPKMEKFLDKSLGVLVYQDDLLYTALEVAGYNWEEVDKFRKAVGKKIPEEMAKQHVIFVEGCMKHSNMTNGEAEGLWDLFVPFQGYGFNKAHSASYGMVSYQTAYMKANYPVEYMTALLSAESGDTDKITEAINECNRMGITVFPPDINNSQVGFHVLDAHDSLNGKGVLFGFSAVKNVGRAAIEAILEAREKANFSSFVDFCQRVDGRRVNKRVLESLIKVGAMSAFGNRATLLESIEEVRAKVKPPTNSSQQGLFFEEEKEKKATSLITHILDTKPEFSEDVLIGLERELMGFSLSAPVVSELVSELAPYKTHSISQITVDEYPRESVKLACVVSEVRVVVTRKTSSEMAFVKVDDGTGILSVVVFPKLYAFTKSLWVEQKPILLSGKIELRDEEVNMLADAIETAENIKAKGGELKIAIPKNTQAASLKALKELLSQNRGSQKAFLLFENSEGQGNAQEIEVPFTISWNQDLSRSISVLLDSRNSTN